MNAFNYDLYIEAIQGLATLPADLTYSEKQMTTALSARQNELERKFKADLDRLEGTERKALEQFDDIACTYKTFFSVPVSRPQPIPSPLSLQDAVKAQNALALQLQVQFNQLKNAAVQQKQLEIQRKQREQAEKAMLQAQEMERKRQCEAEAERKKEEEYIKELENCSRRQSAAGWRKFFKRK